ncbi:hypothetical protein SK128_003577 [Halocaridina rubra]|uniref:Uncharacterized protein n=1 Tax=Halocaridina rubra TaxID=373956 RepID=A0AAN8WFH0_HALRR
MGRLDLHKIGLLSFLVLVKSANINLTGPMETPALANVSVEKDLPSFPVMEITDAPDPVHLTTQPPSALERKDNLNNIQQSHLAPEENLGLTVEAVGMNALGEQSILEAAELSPTTTEVPPWRDTSLCPAGDTVETCQMKKGKCAHLGSVFTPFGGPLKSVTDCVNATGTTLSTDFYDYVGNSVGLSLMRESHMVMRLYIIFGTKPFSLISAAIQSFHLALGFPRLLFPSTSISNVLFSFTLHDMAVPS